MRDEIEIMRVLRLPPMGKLTVETRQERYTSLADLPDKQMQQLIKTAVGELISFVGGYQTLVDAGVAPPLAAAAVQQSEPSPPPPADVRPLAVETAVSPPAPSLNIVDGINTILAQKLASDPALGNQTIKLMQDPAGGLQINVNDRYYQRPEEIEDKAVQTLLRQALKEWENS